VLKSAWARPGCSLDTRWIQTGYKLDASGCLNSQRASKTLRGCSQSRSRFRRTRAPHCESTHRIQTGDKLDTRWIHYGYATSAVVPIGAPWPPSAHPVFTLGALWGPQKSRRFGYARAEPQGTLCLRPGRDAQAGEQPSATPRYTLGALLLDTNWKHTYKLGAPRALRKRMETRRADHTMDTHWIHHGYITDTMGAHQTRRGRPIKNGRHHGRTLDTPWIHAGYTRDTPYS
jgi:hypothetical protein